MNKIVLDKEEMININSDIELLVLKNQEKKIYLCGEESHKLTLRLEENAKLTVYHFGINQSFEVNIFLDRKDAEINYFYSTLNKDKNYFKGNIFHNAERTKSTVITHGLNKEDESLLFELNPKVKKTANKCECHQENSIINQKEGTATIRPNLYIDNYDNISSHSAYIGNFSEEKIFYLMSRGLERKTSIKLLLENFLVPEKEELEKKFPKFLEEMNK